MNLKIPSNLFYKKFHKFKLQSFRKDSKFFCPKFYNNGIQIKKSVKLSDIQIESVRRAIKRYFKKYVILKINVSLTNSITKKPISSRMGKGKGKHFKWIAPIYKGKIIFELFFLDRNLNLNNLNLISKIINSKLPISINFVKITY